MKKSCCTENHLWPKEFCSNTMLSADGSNLLIDKEAILERWAEHFNSVLNRPSSINENAIDRLPQECNVLLHEFITVMETENQFNNCHLAKLQVQMQFLQRFTRLPKAEKLTELFFCIIIHLHKRKGDLRM